LVVPQAGLLPTANSKVLSIPNSRILYSSSENRQGLIIPFAAGGFIYIAGSDLIPELHKECGPKDSFWHIFALLLGIGLMVVLKFIAV